MGSWTGNLNGRSPWKKEPIEWKVSSQMIKTQVPSDDERFLLLLSPYQLFPFLYLSLFLYNWTRGQFKSNGSKQDEQRGYSHGYQISH
jgi:hypothetical protein